MAETKKPVAKVKATATKAAETVKAEVKETVKATAVKETAKAAAVKTEKAAKTVKKATTKAAAKTAAKTEKAAAEVKKTAAKAASTVKKTATKKAAVKEAVSIQFSGKTYSTEDLVKIAKDVWKYDLKQNEADFKSVELYVKPEESIAYYVINGEVTGSFAI